MPCGSGSNEKQKHLTQDRCDYCSASSELHIYLADLCDDHQLLEDVSRDPQRTYMALPKVPQFQNYSSALFGSREFLIPMRRPIINSTIITVVVTFLASFFGGLGGYYLSRTKGDYCQNHFHHGRYRTLLASIRR